MSKSVQIDCRLFWELYKGIVGEWESTDWDYIKRELDLKADKIIRHEIYTRYKTAPTEEEREKARKEYLDSVGIPDEWRWSSSGEREV